MEATTPWEIYAASGSAFCFSLIWLVVNAIGLFQILRVKDKSEPISKVALAAWIIAFAGGFTGPCVLLLSLVALIIGMVAMPRALDARSRIAARTAVVGSILIILMGVVMLIFLMAGDVI